MKIMNHGVEFELKFVESSQLNKTQQEFAGRSVICADASCSNSVRLAAWRVDDNPVKQLFARVAGFFCSFEMRQGMELLSTAIRRDNENSELDNDVRSHIHDFKMGDIEKQNRDTDDPGW